MKRVRKINFRIACCVLGGALCFSNTAQAAGFELFPKISVAKKNTQFLDKAGGFDINTNLHTLELGLTGAIESWYASVTFDQSLNSNSTINNGLELNTSREDTALTLGYRFVNDFYIFAGYKDGRSDFGVTEIATNQLSTLVFRDRGPFAGISYNFETKHYGALGVSAAYASMQGDFSKKIEITGATIDIDGQTIGLSYNAGWSYPVSNDSLLSIAIKVHQYQFTSDTLDYDQNFNMFVISLATRL